MNKRSVSFAALAATVSLASTFAEASVTYVYSFNDGLRPNTLNTSASPGYSVDFSTGAAVLTKQSGFGNGSAIIVTSFDLVGDFTATVDIFRNSLERAANAGIYVFDATGSAGIFAQGPGGESGLNSIISYVSLPNGLPQGQQYSGYGSNIQFANTGGLSQFRITRTGNSLNLLTNQGSGFTQFQTTATSPEVGGPLTLALFLDQEYGNKSLHQVTFDNLTISADSVSAVPEPSIWGLALGGLGGILLRSRSNRKQH